MRKKSEQDVASDFTNADAQALMREDESATSGEDAPEFANPPASYTNSPAQALEKGFQQNVTPEELYKAEHEMLTASVDYPTMIQQKEEQNEQARMQEVAQLREQQQKPVGFSGQPPQIPGAATHPATTPHPQGPPSAGPPAQPQNPFANYTPPSQPESGLPYKPKGIPDFTPLPSMKVTKHDCLTVHGYEKHEDWARKQEEDCGQPTDEK
jgi:hypothetical protein